MQVYEASLMLGRKEGTKVLRIALITAFLIEKEIMDKARCFVVFECS
jgi:hypothetical protein